MNIKILVEDKSGELMLVELVRLIVKGTKADERTVIGDHCTVRIYGYKGGTDRINPKLKPKTDASKRILLDGLWGKLQGIARNPNEDQVVLVVLDLDNRNYDAFMNELHEGLNRCHPRPVTHFCLAVEEGEAWLLADTEAILRAYDKKVKINKSVLKSYKLDHICDTWECLADAIYPGGAKRLKADRKEGYMKCEWAKNISPHVDVDNHRSPSFQHFRDTLRGCCE